MTNMVQPRTAAETDTGANQDGELTTLIRRWMAAGGRPQRVRRGGILRLAPEPYPPEPFEEEPAGTEKAGTARLEPLRPLPPPPLPRRSIAP